jgi:NAD(P)-dependent dehydrogenase (short-subunit alcohol dehydrogenase family)
MHVTMKDRVAVVTGGSKGLGLAMARQFSASGARVAILARGAPDLKAARELLAKDGLQVRDYVCDVSNAAEIAKVHDRIVGDLGPVDILVNNAGTARTLAFESISDEAWQEDLDLKLFAAIRFSRLVWPGMKARKWGRIINVLNTFAKAPAASTAPTSVSRAAGMALTKVMASEGGEHNILVNAMLVGLIMSDQWVKRHAAQAPDTDFEVFAKNLAKGTPLGRIGTAENSPTWPLLASSRVPISPAPPQCRRRRSRWSGWFNSHIADAVQSATLASPSPRSCGGRDNSLLGVGVRALSTGVICRRPCAPHPPRRRGGLARLRERLKQRPPSWKPLLRPLVQRPLSPTASQRP